MPASDNNHEQLVALWSIQDSLLQSYRSIFISAQSIVAGFAAAIATTEKPLIVAALIALGLFIHCLWLSVCQSRALDVSFVQWRILEAEEGRTTPKPLAAFKEFQKTRVFEDVSVLGQPQFKEDAQSTTRRRMDRQLPLAFGMLWLGLALYVLVDYLFS